MVFPRIIFPKVDLKYIWLIVVIFIVAFFVRFGIYDVKDFVFDDAYIGARIAKNFADGFGLVYNIGDNIQTNTSLMFGLFFGLLWKVIGETSFNAIRIIGAIVDSVVALGIAWLFWGAREVGNYNIKRYFLAFAAGMTYAISATAAIPAVGGLETPYYALFIIMMFIALQRNYFNLAILLAVLGVFMRPDGIVAAIIVTMFVLFKQKKNITPQLLLILVSAIIYCATLLSMYGTLIPQSVVAKSLIQGPAIEQWIVFLNKFYFSWALVPGLFSVIGVYYVLSRRRDLMPIFIWGFAYAFLLSSFASWWSWYFPPFVIVYVLSIFAGVGYITEVAAASNFFLKRMSIIIIGVISIIILSGFAIKSYSSIIALNKESSGRWKEELIIVTNWIKSNIPPDKNIMLASAGLFGFLLPHQIDDYPGLASPQVTAALSDYRDTIGSPYENEPEAWSYIINKIKPYAIITEKEISNSLIKNGIIDQYEIQYYCCLELVNKSEEPGPYLILIRRPEVAIPLNASQ